MKKLFYLFSLFMFVACGYEMKLGYQPDSSLIVGVNSLTMLDPGENHLEVRAFIMNPDTVDSVSTTTSAVVASLSEDHRTISLFCSDSMPAMGAVELWVGGHPYAIPVRRSDKVDFTFTYDPHGMKSGRVQIAGQMNNWAADNTSDLVLGEDGLYSVTMRVSPGTYLYQMKIDGVQSHDENNPNRVDNGYGAFNSIMQVPGFDDALPRLSTEMFTPKTISLLVENEVDDVWAYVGNTRLDSRFYTVAKGRIEIVIPAEFAKEKHQLVRIWASNQYGISNDIYVPLSSGKVVTKASGLAVNDKHQQIIYFLLVDRFQNGDTANDLPMKRADVHPKADYQGGDLSGVRDEIAGDYFSRLGVNALWLSPLNQNPMEPYGYNDVAKTKFAGYHGYWPVSSSKVDCRFGTNEELKSLVADAHAKGLRVYLDYVANHVHEDHPLFRNHPEYATPLYLPDGRKNVELWDEQRLTTWFDTFLPTLDYGNPAVVSAMVDSALFWVREFGVDGFRHDACKHVNEEYWRELTYRLKEARRDGGFYQIGESYGSPELMASYVNSGMLDGQFDFNVYDEATSAFNGVSGGTMTRLANILKSSLKVYGTHNLMGYISGNHDKPRFMAMASGDIAVGEDAKLAGWTREVGVSDSTAYERLAVFHTFNGTIPGVPVYYYGDEIGMTGGNDPDCRRMMRFENLNPREEKLLDHVSRLNHLRLSNMPLLYGDFELISVSDETMCFVRHYFSQNTFVFINNSRESQTFSVELNALCIPEAAYRTLFDMNYTISGGVLSITLPALSSEVIY